MLRCAKLWSLLASNTMKSPFSSVLVLAAVLLILEPFIVSAETFTEGVRVSPETVKLKPTTHLISQSSSAKVCLLYLNQKPRDEWRPAPVREFLE